MTTIHEHLADSRADAFDSTAFSEYMDNLPLALSDIRSQFAYPTRETLSSSSTVHAESVQPSGNLPLPIYLCGNSLGLMPTKVKTLVCQELDVWSGRGVLGHFDHPLERPWKDITDKVQGAMARIVGARESEVAVMGTLTTNLHTLLSSFFKPAGMRTKIMYEAKAFPSDEYAFASQIRLHGLRPRDHLIAVAPRHGEYTLRTEDILQKLEDHREEIAVVMFSGVQYYTGQFFDIETITAKGHNIGAIVGWDLAHAVGNVPLELHEWRVDFACWCNYKYMNAGPGAIAGIFVHSDAKAPSESQELQGEYNYDNRLSGWWGHNAKTRFMMDPTFDPMPGAAGYQMSNPSVLNVVSLLASLEIFDTTSMQSLRDKSVLLTGYLEALLSNPVQEDSAHGARLKVITPTDSAARGAQLSVLFEPVGQGVMEYVMKVLIEREIICDERQPDVIRLSPIPSYNTFSEVRKVAQTVREALQSWRPSKSGDGGELLQTT